MKETLQAISKRIRVFLIVVLMSGTLILSGCSWWGQNKSSAQTSNSESTSPAKNESSIFCFWSDNCSSNTQIDQSQHPSQEEAQKILSRDDVRGADLTGVDLPGANLRGRNLHGVKLSGADLHDAKLQGANLSGADLSGADLRNANLTGTDLTGANLDGADLTGANLKGAKMPT